MMPVRKIPLLFRGVSDAFQIRHFAVDGAVEACGLAGFVNFYGCYPVDHPQHPVSKYKRPNRGQQHRAHLNQKEMRVTTEQSIRTCRIEECGGKNAAEDDADKAADTVDAPDIESVVPAEFVL